MRCPQPIPLQYRRLLVLTAAARRARAGSPEEPPRYPRPSSELEALSIFGNLPLRARLADRFSDAMFAMEEALSMCEVECNASRDASWIEPQIRISYEQINTLMKAVAD